MRLIRERPRGVLLVLGLLLYMIAGLTFTDLDAVEVAAESTPACSVPLLRSEARSARPEALTVLQGNFWMLPSRPLLVPYDFSTDRRERLERMIDLVRGCEPDVVVLQEVFESSVLDALARGLPDYAIHTSGRTEARGSVNTSGLATLTRVPAHNRAFRGFDALPRDAKIIERMGRKGFLVTDVAVPSLHLTIINTHLYAPRDSWEEALTKAQLQELLAFVRAEEAAGRTILLTGDFNLERAVLADGLPSGWTISEHGPTYDPASNPYTVQGANDTSGNHLERRLGEGTRAVDFMVARLTGNQSVASRVLDQPLMSDHQFIAHRVTPDLLSSR